MEGLDEKALFDKMLSGVDRVKIGVFGRLAQRYETKMGREEANLLAAAITNELFSDTPSNPGAQRFLESNRTLIEKEILNLQNDDEIRNAVTQAVRVKAIVSYDKSGNAQESLLDPLEKLKKLGILVPGGETPSPENFLPMAVEFYDATPR